MESLVKSVPFFDYSRAYSDDRENLLRIFDEVSSRGSFILQSELSIFENNLADYCGSNYSIGVANATDGMELAWMALGICPGDEVICSSHTMLATASAVKTAGGVPIPVDIGDDGLIDSGAIEDALSERTVGIMPTHLNGRTCNMDDIMAIATKKGLAVVEDAAQALGSQFKGKFAGTFGSVSAISFYPAKVLGCLGDGGAVLVRDRDLYEKIYQLHDHGRGFDGDVKLWGRNSRLDNVQAAILDYRLSKYHRVINRRRQIAKIYNDHLSAVKEIKLPPKPNDDGVYFDIYQNYEIQVEHRDRLKKYLNECGIGTLVQWGGKAIHQWEALGFNMHLPRVEDFFKRCIMLPINSFVSDEDVIYVCDHVRRFYSRKLYEKNV